MDNRNSEKYYTAGKNLGIFALTATLVMTELNTSTLIGFSSLGYIYGSSAISLGLVFLIGLLFYTFTVAKKWKNFNAITVSEFFSQRYNPMFGLVVAVCLLVAMLGFGANFIHSITICLSEIFPNYNHWMLSGIACVIMGAFTIRDGLISIIRIDRISFVLCILFFLYLFYIVSGLGGSLGATKEISKINLPFSFSISLSIITAFTYILSPWYGQKVFAAKSTKIAFYSVFLALLGLMGGLARL